MKTFHSSELLSTPPKLIMYIVDGLWRWLLVQEMVLAEPGLRALFSNEVRAWTAR